MNRRRYLLLVCMAGIALALAPRAVDAQAVAVERLSDQEPFDRITLDQENQGLTIKVEPLELPERRVPPMPNPEERLRVKLYAQLDKTYEIAWKHITKIELYEEMLLAEAQQFIQQDRLDDAFDALQHLKQNYPNAPGLSSQIEAYLYISAGRLFREERWSEALGVLEELHKLNPDYKLSASTRSLPQVLSAVLEKIVAGYVTAGDYRAARLFLGRIRRDYGDKYATTVNQWEQQLQMLAAKERDAAQAFVGINKWREAHRALRKMTDVWPDIDGGAALAADVAAKYPIVAVGITQPARYDDIRRVDDWAARRTGKLTARQLVEYLKPGNEGGHYAFRYGTLQMTEDRRRITLTLAANDLPAGSVATGYDLAQRLIEVAGPKNADYAPTWASLVRTVGVRDVMRVDIDLRRSYVVPEASLQMPWNPASAAGVKDATGAFRAAPAEGVEQPYEMIERGNDQATLAEIMERTYDDSVTITAALRRGEIDVIDRLFPADVAALASDSNVRVGRYTLPTLHFLIPSPKSAMGQNATIRRAIAYGIPREAILKEQLLGGRNVAGCRIITGPFSPGASDNDPLSYAVDNQIPLRPTDPRLAATLIGLVERQQKSEAEKQMQPVKPLALVIGFPQSEVARVACQSIAQQLTVLGLPTTLKALPAGETRDTKDECDFVYTETIMGEPMIDARRLLGADGVVRSTDPYITLALRRLDEATTWPQARERLKELHRIVHADVTIIPLWQLVEHYAFRKELAGPEVEMVWLYENVAKWRRAGEVATAQVAK